MGKESLIEKVWLNKKEGMMVTHVTLHDHLTPTAAAAADTELAMGSSGSLSANGSLSSASSLADGGCISSL
jgi:hypothetical protein